MAETSTNASVLTITAFTVERYLAICHPFLAHTISDSQRVIKYILTIWIVALLSAIPQVSKTKYFTWVLVGKMNFFLRISDVVGR